MDKALSYAVCKFAGLGCSEDPATDVQFVQELKPRQRAHSFCHYIIRNNVIHRQCYGENVGFKMFPDNIFGFLSR